MDILMVNRSVLPKVGKIVLADVNGEVIVKKTIKSGWTDDAYR